MKRALGLIETRGLVAAVAAADEAIKSANVILEGKQTTEPGFVTIMFSGGIDEIRTAVTAGAKAAKNAGELISSTVISDPDNQLVLLLPGIINSISNLSEKKRQSLEIIEAPAAKSADREKKPGAAIKIKHGIKKESRQDNQKELKKEISTVPEKMPVEYPVIQAEIKRNKSEAKNPKENSKVIKEKEEGTKVKLPGTLFEPSSETIDRLRREALGKSYSVPQPHKIINDEKNNGEMAEDIEKINVHKLRKLARNTPGFPIQGRKISKASRSELLELFNNKNS
jgi:ethanolamine utilization protein EutM